MVHASPYADLLLDPLLIINGIFQTVSSGFVVLGHQRTVSAVPHHLISEEGMVLLDVPTRRDVTYPILTVQIDLVQAPERRREQHRNRT